LPLPGIRPSHRGCVAPADIHELETVHDHIPNGYFLEESPRGTNISFEWRKNRAGAGLEVGPVWSGGRYDVFGSHNLS
jgi:hypothetical protein